MATSSGAFERVRDHLGEAIADGSLARDTVITVDELQQRTGTSRSIVREATRVLVSMGLLSATQRVGLRVLPESRWNVLDPHVIRWRLRSPERQRQVTELLELRLAVEPEAARLAAARRDSEQARALEDIADRLSTSGADDRQADFLDADLAFHGLILQAAHNATFVRLSGVLDEALRDRAIVGRADRPPDEHDLRLHTAVAKSIKRGDGASASARMREIIARTDAS